MSQLHDPVMYAIPVFAVFVLLVGLVVCGAMLLRKNHIPGTALGPTRRLVGVAFASLLLLMFTPTKFTHHFGVFAGFGAAVGAVVAIAVAGGEVM